MTRHVLSCLLAAAICLAGGALSLWWLGTSWWSVLIAVAGIPPAYLLIIRKLEARDA